MAPSNSSSAQEHLDAEKSVQRNPHGDFKAVEASRPDWSSDRKFTFSKTKTPDWKFGGGGNDSGESLKKQHVEIDPYEEGRAPVLNYKLLISGIVPRPIGFVSTISKDGSSTNLSPFSYFQMVAHDPPIFVLGFAGGIEKSKDTLRNIIDTGECVINIISEHFIEAANATSINAPYGTSEWAITGLHPAPSTTVRPSRVRESVFSVECRLMDVREFDSKSKPGTKSGSMATVEGTRFWVREDAINEQKSLIDPDVLRPMSRLGGITYARVLDAIEIPRLVLEDELEKSRDKLEPLLKPKADGQ